MDRKQIFTGTEQKPKSTHEKVHYDNAQHPKLRDCIKLSKELLEIHNAFPLPMKHRPAVALIEIILLNALSITHEMFPLDWCEEAQSTSALCPNTQNIIFSLEILIPTIKSIHVSLHNIQDEIKAILKEINHNVDLNIFNQKNDEQGLKKQLSPAHRSALQKIATDIRLLHGIIKHSHHYYDPDHITVPTAHHDQLWKDFHTTFCNHHMITNTAQYYNRFEYHHEDDELIKQEHHKSFVLGNDITMSLYVYNLSQLHFQSLSLLQNIDSKLDEAFTSLTTSYLELVKAMQVRCDILVESARTLANPQVAIATLYRTLFMITLLYGAPLTAIQTTKVLKSDHDTLSQQTQLAAGIHECDPYNAMFLVDKIISSEYLDNDFKYKMIVEDEFYSPGFQQDVTFTSLNSFRIAMIYGITDLITLFCDNLENCPDYYPINIRTDIRDQGLSFDDVDFNHVRSCLRQYNIYPTFEHYDDIVFSPVPTPSREYQIEVASYCLYHPNRALDPIDLVYKIIRTASPHHIHRYIQAYTTHYIKKLKNDNHKRGKELNYDVERCLADFTARLLWNINCRFSLIPIIWHLLCSLDLKDTIKTLIEAFIPSYLSAFYDKSPLTYLVEDGYNFPNLNLPCLHFIFGILPRNDTFIVSHPSASHDYRNTKNMEVFNPIYHSHAFTSRHHEKNEPTSTILSLASCEHVEFDPTDSLPNNVIIPPPIIYNRKQFMPKYTPISAISPSTPELENFNSNATDSRQQQKQKQQNVQKGTSKNNNMNKNKNGSNNNNKDNNKIFSKNYPYDQSNHLVGDLTLIHNDIRFVAYLLRLLFQDIISADEEELLSTCVSSCHYILPYAIPHVPFLDFKNNHAALCYAIRRGARQSMKYLLLEYDGFRPPRSNQFRPRFPPPQPKLSKVVTSSSSLSPSSLPPTLISQQYIKPIDLNSLTVLHSLSLMQLPLGCRLHNSLKCGWCLNHVQDNDEKHRRKLRKVISKLPTSYVDAIMAVSERHVYGNPLNFAICNGNFDLLTILPDHKLNMKTIVDDFTHLVKLINQSMQMNSSEFKHEIRTKQLGAVVQKKIDECKNLIGANAKAPGFEINSSHNTYIIKSLRSNSYWRTTQKKHLLGALGSFSLGTMDWKRVHENQVCTLGNSMYENFNEIDELITDPVDLINFRNECSFRSDSPVTQPVSCLLKTWTMTEQCRYVPVNVESLLDSEEMKDVLESRAEYNEICKILASDAKKNFRKAKRHGLVQLDQGSYPAGVCDEYEFFNVGVEQNIGAILQMIVHGYHLHGWRPLK